MEARRGPAHRLLGCAALLRRPPPRHRLDAGRHRTARRDPPGRGRRLHARDRAHRRVDHRPLRRPGSGLVCPRPHLRPLSITPRT
ncbi:hypothetical protein SGPA1_11404 [Streptomyces misionensis JCM 4497]